MSTSCDQGQYGTVLVGNCLLCHTILEAQNDGIVPDEAHEYFSPTWVYEQVKFSFDNQCALGAYIESALDLLKDKGDVSLKKIPYVCGTQITDLNKKICPL